jgi:hypothetical protein
MVGSKPAQITIHKLCGCSRCGKVHINIEFTHLKRVAGDWTHWAMCPVTKEPILLEIIEGNTK